MLHLQGEGLTWPVDTTDASLVDLGGVLKAAVNDSSQALRLQDEVTEARGRDGVATLEACVLLLEFALACQVWLYAHACFKEV